ncbi:arf-GAP with Rho-GAP domain, ANK repeat and PH domain-containing protein 1 isoform X2 [Kryptolebias marmoratus]|uniref:arf-GAP with Rho-GAP domain, ANK repeat and PH domain-containing protein 1 isoform X2 n=1 Tax=Kryptolebias marmoratus TaxID=37003 RepID=UPI0007F8686A|nr:arf-GAP with Rho-GAP domain, ANK repeat and PH domain-containing protein 1 isoform X2 [Kryptolebias marmoratus]
MLTLTHASDVSKSIMSQSKPDPKMLDWLYKLRLERYMEAFQSAGMATLQECLNLTPDQLDQMGITLPGHQRRILTSLNNMHNNHDAQMDHSEVVSVSLGGENVDGNDRDCERRRPIPRERGKPVPKQRDKFKMLESSDEERDMKPVPGKRSSVPAEKREDAEDVGMDARKEKPVPKQRTKFRTSSPVDHHSSSLVPPTPDTSLPPVPPRINNGPPQRFTSSQSPPPPTPRPSSSRAEQLDVLPPPVPCRSLPPVSSSASTPIPTEAPIPNLNVQSTESRPQTLAIQPPTLILSSVEVRKTSPLTPGPPASGDQNIPPLPPKVLAGPKGPPPVPLRVPPLSPRTQSLPTAKTRPDEPTATDEIPQIPPYRQALSVIETSQEPTPPDAQPALPPRRSPQLPSVGSVDGSSDEYEDPDLCYPSVHWGSVSDREMSLQVPRTEQERYSFLESDDELLDGDEFWQDKSSRTSSFLLPHTNRPSALIKEDDSQLSAVIKMGWLDKNLPQGVLYQRRWAKLDADYLRYFDNEKDVYSKGFVSTAFISHVSSMGELKFEVVTSNRTFIFKAESEAERNDWVNSLKDCTRGRQRQSSINFVSTVNPDYQGFLEIRGLRSKYYTVVASDKVFLYKNLDDYRIGLGITSIDMNVGNIKESDRRSFDLTTPYRTFRSLSWVCVSNERSCLCLTVCVCVCVCVRVSAHVVWCVWSFGRQCTACRARAQLDRMGNCEKAFIFLRIVSLFVAESEQMREQWVDAMRNAIGEALSNSEVAEQIWAEPSNSVCADCGALKPDWAAVNLCVVICKQCAGEHRGLGPSISKVRSLKMDKKVWTKELIQVFLELGNERVNSFWAANVPPSEALMPSSSSEERRRFICNKYRQGKYRKYHALYGNQKELNNALCINVQCSDLLETLSLIFCGAEVNCPTGMESCPTLENIASSHSQPLQAELIRHNLNTELPQLPVDSGMDLQHYQPSPCVSYNGFLSKTASMTRAVTECKPKEEFSRRWCTLNDGIFSYYESDKNANPNGVIKASEMVCLAVIPSKKHGFEHTFEVYSENERLYLFGTDDADGHKEWVKCLAKSFIPTSAEPLLRLSFDRIGRLKCKDGLNLQQSKVGWFALVGSTLHFYLEGSKGEEIHLRRVNELSIQQDSEVLVLVERGRTLYIEGERKLDFAGWCGAIQAAGMSGGDTLSQQQLTETDVPVIVLSCIDYITQCGLMSEGIYRKSGVNSRVAALCDRFRQDARSLRLKEGEHQVDDVSNALKRFFRELEEGLFTSKDAKTWLSVTGIQDENEKIRQYKRLLDRLPRVNKATLQALINHLYCVQRYSELNQMNLHNLAIVFGPTLFQTDGKDYTAGRAIEDLIQHYTLIFEVSEQQLNRQLDEIKAIIDLRNTHTTKFPPLQKKEGDGHFICTVYLQETEPEEQLVKVPGSMTAAELTCGVLDRRNILVREKDYWSCWEVCDKEEMERPLHYQERVLPILHSIGADSRLLIKKHPDIEAMMSFLTNKVDVAKHGIMKFREERSILGLGLSTGNFHERYFILNVTSLRMYKDVRSNRPDREWPVKSLKIYLGIKKKLRPPTHWGLTVVYESKKPERQQWYLCCESQSEMREWYATFLSIQYDGDMWPQDGLQRTRVIRTLPDTRHGNVSLIPLRGSENEMRNSVAAFSQDPLALFRDVR